MASSLEEEKSKVGIPLREWIRQAIKSVDVIATNNEGYKQTFGGSNDTSSKSLAITSSSYIFAALKVASSLANQLCQSSQQNDELHNNSSGISISLPTPCDTDWSDQIIVHTTKSTNSEDFERDLLYPLEY